MMKLVIFDLDGTLLDTKEDLIESINYTLKKFGYQQEEPSVYLDLVGKGIKAVIEHALPEPVRTKEEIARLKSQFECYYSAHMMRLTKPYPGVIELLTELRHRGVVLAVVSNKAQEEARELIRHYFKSGTFDVVLGQREGEPMKPNPAIVNEILGTTGMDEKDALYVGDSTVDIETAHKAGIISVAVTWGFFTRQELKKYGADYVVDNPADVLKLI